MQKFIFIMNYFYFPISDFSVELLYIYMLRNIFSLCASCIFFIYFCNDFVLFWSLFWFKSIKGFFTCRINYLRYVILLTSHFLSFAVFLLRVSFACFCRFVNFFRHEFSTINVFSALSPTYKHTEIMSVYINRIQRIDVGWLNMKTML